jgi:cell fate regulator YaaT (PSP1 superfamily)
MELPPHMKPFDVVEVRFKGTRKEFYRNVHDHDITLNDMVVVEVENGYDIGQVSTKGELVKLQLKKNSLQPDGQFRKIVRRATDADLAKWKENKALEVPTMYKARTIALELGLKMKLSDVEYQGDKRKAIFYYTAEERVDFRELIKKLADAFKVRIEMKQIGYRQEAGRLGGIGSCGRELCCSTWLTDFKVVTTGAARYQNLSLNPLKLSGQCGRLKCCLNYELDVYMEAIKDFPREDDLVLEFADGEYKSVKTDILKRMMWFAPRYTPGEWKGLHVDKVKEYRELNKQGVKPEVVIEKPVPKIKEIEFLNDMGTESITRLDERKSGNRKKKSKGKPKPQGREGGQGDASREKRSASQRPPQQQRSQRPQGNEQRNPEHTGNDRPPRQQDNRRETNQPRNKENRRPEDNQPREQNRQKPRPQQNRPSGPRPNRPANPPRGNKPQGGEKKDNPGNTTPPVS